jgi:trans-aconitate methyltransferase
MHALALLAAVDLSAARSICDVGGGTGELLRTLLDHLPAAEGTVLDLTPVVERAVPHPRLTACSGDAFESVPADHDLYLLVNVLHDWGDPEASSILARIVEAAPGARVLVVDAGRPVVPRDRVATAADVLMAALTEGGRERDRAQLADLGRTAGLELVGSTLLASGDWAHELGVARSCS